MTIDYGKRQVTLQKEIGQRGLDSFLITNEKSVAYLSGFAGSDSTLLITPRDKFFITDSRYHEEAGESVKGFGIIRRDLSTYETLERIARKKRLKKIGFESMDLPYEVAERLKALLGHARLVPFKDLIEGMRSIKDKAEIDLIRRSIRITKDALKKVLKHVRPGVSERFLSARIELELIEKGARPAFDPIVAFGKNSSKPHARPTDASLEDNGHIMIDIGCIKDGYNSDLTRMVFLGRVKQKIKKICAVVRIAQEKALEMIRPGARMSEVDFAARRYIQKQGFGKYFGHSVGHGVGMAVHEKPSISRANHDLLKPGMVFTVEPAIYIPRLGGVRIEDMVLVTERGCEVLTR